MPNFHEPVIIEKATPIYRAILLECERRRQELGWPMWRLDDAAGLQDGYYAKCLHAARKSGRQAKWPVLDLIVAALFPDGFDLQMSRKTDGPLTADGCRLKVMFAASDNDRVTRRKLMGELGRRGADARAKMPPEWRREIAQRAAETRKANKIRLAAPKSQRVEIGLGGSN